MQKFESNSRQRALSPFSRKVTSVVSKILLVIWTGCSVLISEKSWLLRCYSNFTIGETYCRNILPLFHHSIFSIWDMLLAPFAPCRQWKQRVVSSSEAKIGIVHAQYIFACRTAVVCKYMSGFWIIEFVLYQNTLLHHCLLQEKLVDRAVVQFYHKPSQLFLGVHKSEVTLIDDEEDNKSNVFRGIKMIFMFQSQIWIPRRKHFADCWSLPQYKGPQLQTLTAETFADG